jgi:hypothetical protein
MLNILPDRIEISCEQNLLYFAEYIVHTNLGKSSDSRIHENYSICLYLLAFYMSNKIYYPTIIEILGNNDPPDFIITMSNPPVKTGIEHTRATNESYIIAKKEMDQRRDISLLESSFYMFKNALPKNRAFAGLKTESDGLTGEPLFGDAHITNWVDFVIEAYLKKSIAQRDVCNNFEKYELLVEMEIANLIGDDHSKALKLLKYRIESWDIPATYQKLHIYSQNRVIIDALGNGEIIELSKKKVKVLYKKFKTHNTRC